MMKTIMKKIQVLLGSKCLARLHLYESEFVTVTFLIAMTISMTAYI